MFAAGTSYSKKKKKRKKKKKTTKTADTGNHHTKNDGKQNTTSVQVVCIVTCFMCSHLFFYFLSF